MAINEMKGAASDQARLPLSLSRASRRRNGGRVVDETSAITGFCVARV